MLIAEEMQNIIQKLEEASNAYYVLDDPIMTDYQYDALFDKLVSLEESSGIILSRSPTQKVGGQVMSGLTPVVHTKPMLSAKKTKDDAEIAAFSRKALVANDKMTVLSWKMDGLTLVVRYRYGKLEKLITRGNGSVGEDVTHNACAILNLPLQIPDKSEVELRGECVIRRSTFARMNEESGDSYSLERSYAGGSIRKLDSNEARKRNLSFFAFELVSPQFETLEKNFEYMEGLGLPVVEHIACEPEEVIEKLNDFNPENFDYPVDGIIAEYNDRAFGLAQGSTGHHENCRIAKKWKDDTKKTHFLGVVRRTNRTGIVSIKAKFEPVEVDGSTLSCATLHNLDFFENLELGLGDELEVYKANMIIPAIAENNTRSKTYKIEMTCPCCGSNLQVFKKKKARMMRCPNEKCSSRLVRQFEYFASKKAVNINGLAGSKLEDLLDSGYVKTFVDLYHLDRFHNEIVSMDGWGESSYQNLQEAIEKSRDIRLAQFLTSFGIPQVGSHASKEIDKYFKGSPDAFLEAVAGDFDFHALPDFGDIMCENLQDFFSKDENINLWNALTREFRFEMDSKETRVDTGDKHLLGKIVVATGSFVNFTRDSINEAIEQAGGKASGSVSKKTTYVVAGEKAGSKLKKAYELGIQVLTEDEFRALIAGK